MKKITCSFIKDKKLLGFTLAEVLITLTIIGVVAALTIPSLLANINEKTYEAKRKGFYTRLAQAVSQMDALNSYEARRPSDYSGEETSEEYAEKYSSMNFITEGLSKVYKLSNICEFENFTACDYPTQERDFWISGGNTVRNRGSFAELTKKGTGEVPNYLNTIPAAFRTKNGESGILYYNPRCTAEQTLDSNNQKNMMSEVCVFIRFDLDGAKKGPNALGKDIGYLTIFYPDTPYVIGYNGIYSGYSNANSLTYAEAEDACNERSAYGIVKGNWTLPTIEEFITITLSIGWNSDVNYWTSSIEGSEEDDYAWFLNTRTKTSGLRVKNLSGGAICVIKETR